MLKISALHIDLMQPLLAGRKTMQTYKILGYLQSLLDLL